MSCIPWEPRDGEKAFIDRCVERRARGWTWRKIAKAEHDCGGLGTLDGWFAKNPGIKDKIYELVDGINGEALENIRQTLMEVAIEKKDRQILIHLSKAKLKNYEQPTQEPVTVIANQVLAPSFSKEEAEKILAAMVDDVSKAK